MKPKLVMAEFQPVTRDFAFVVGRDVAAADILRAAESAERRLVADVAVFDVFEGAALGEGKKSVGIAVTLQPTERTLTDAEIDAVSAKIVETVAKRTGAVLRG
jgi:phenylalanyl-tRNA synthetase beta chain